MSIDRLYSVLSNSFTDDDIPWLLTNGYIEYVRHHDKTFAVYTTLKPMTFNGVYMPLYRTIIIANAPV